MLSKFIIFLSLITSISLADTAVIKVMVIDTGISATNFAFLQYVNRTDMDKHPESYIDYHGHGTHVAGLVVKDTCSQVKLYSCAYYQPADDQQTRWEKLLNCYKRAYDENIDFVNFSSGGESPYLPEYKALKLLFTHKNTTLIVPAGNDGKDLKNPCWGYFPACYYLPNMVVLGNSNSDGSRHVSSNYGLDGMKWENGVKVLSEMPNNTTGYLTGTSQSTAIYTNSLIKKRCQEINK
jgi:subtilisin family serine protease